MDQAIEVAAKKPLLRRIVDFPLVAMLIAVALIVVAVAIGFNLGKLVPAGLPARGILVAAINLALVLLAYKLAIVRLGERPRDDLPARNSLRQLGKGLALGIALFSVAVAIAGALGVYRIIGRGDGSALLLDLVAVGIVPALIEEILFRGILFRWIEEFGGSWAALVVTSALFGLAHILNPGASWFSSFTIAVEAGLLLGGAYLLTRTLWMPIGLHAAWNFTQGAIFGVPVSGQASHGLLQATLTGPALLSGGAFGLEASVIALAVCTAAGLWLVVLAVRRGEVVQPWWVGRAPSGIPIER
jgi:hypothetical protein